MPKANALAPKVRNVLAAQMFVPIQVVHKPPPTPTPVHSAQGDVNAGPGWLGRLKRPDGGTSSEISAGFNIDGKVTEIPLLVPTLNSDEVDYLLSADPTKEDFFRHMPQSIMQKAMQHATERIAKGQSPYKV